MVKEIFSNDFAFTGRVQSKGFQLYERPGLGIIASEGERWEIHRRFLLRQLRDFGFGKSTMEGLIMDEANELIETYKQKAGTPITLIREQVKLAVINSLFRILTSKRFKQDDPK